MYKDLKFPVLIVHRDIKADTVAGDRVRGIARELEQEGFSIFSAVDYAEGRLVASTQKAFDLSEARFKAGVDNYLTVLDAQRSLYAAQQTLIGLRQAEQVNRVTLWKVLGGTPDAG